MNFLAFSSLLGMLLKIMHFTVYFPFSYVIFQNLVLGSMIFLRQDNMIEHDRIFNFVYVNSGMWVDVGSRGASTIDVQNKRLLMRGGRAVEQ